MPYNLRSSTRKTGYSEKSQDRSTSRGSRPSSAGRPTSRRSRSEHRPHSRQKNEIPSGIYIRKSKKVGDGSSRTGTASGQRDHSTEKPSYGNRSYTIPRWRLSSSWPKYKSRCFAEEKAVNKAFEEFEKSPRKDTVDLESIKRDTLKEKRILHAFTDASQTDVASYGSIGVVVIQELVANGKNEDPKVLKSIYDRVFAYSSKCKNFAGCAQLEMYAAYFVLEFLNTKKGSGNVILPNQATIVRSIGEYDKVVIHSDSLSLVEGVEKKHNMKNADNKTLLSGIKAEIKKLGDRGIEVKFRYVKGHAGSVPNCAADLLAEDMHSDKLIADRAIIDWNHIRKRIGS